MCDNTEVNCSKDLSLVIEINPTDYCPMCNKMIGDHDENSDCLWINREMEFPDVLLCGHYPLVIVSNRVIEAWQKNNVTGYIAHSINKLVDSNRCEINAPVRYFNIIITGRAELDLEKMGISIIKQCATCNCVEYDKPSWEFGEAYIKAETYDGSDLFVDKHFTQSVMCTQKILEIVYREKLTNFEFRKLEAKFKYMVNSVIDLKSLFDN